jgi:diguanylate cyclase (GGDEF)-like protein
VPAVDPGELTVFLCSADPSLKQAWGRVEPPRGFRLRTLPHLKAGDLAADGLSLMIVDARAVLEADDALAEAFHAAAQRCIWAGAAEEIERLGPDRVGSAYTVLLVPTSPAVLSQRLAEWARNIQRTAALDEIGRRVESLAGQNQRLTARVAEIEAQASGLARQHERLDHVLRRIRRVALLSREINCLDLDRITRVCVQDLPALLEAERASLYLYDAGADRLVLQGQSPGPHLAERVDLRDSPRSPMAVALRRGELLLVGEFREFEQAANVVMEREYESQYASRSCIIVPLKGGGSVRGILNLADKRGAVRFDEDVDLPVVEQIAELIGASIYNVELYQEMERRAKTDPLTGLANRRAMEEALARETDRCRRYGTRLAVAMIDVDHLKTINDRFGHEAGDDVLRNLAATIDETIRSVDVPGRWTGGDEFLILLPDTSALQAARLAQRLLDSLRQHPVTRDRQQVPSSLSIGVAEFVKADTVESLIRRVDQALYAAKQGGRDQVSQAPDPPATA